MMNSPRVWPRWRGSLLALIAGFCPSSQVASSDHPIVALQAFRQVESATLPGVAGHAVLTQLNPNVNAWLLLSLPAADGRGTVDYHLENPDPHGQRVHLGVAGTLRITGRSMEENCAIWPAIDLERARRTRLAYAPLCNDRLSLRNALPGRRTTLETTTEFLRDHVWGGEKIVGLVKREFYRDAFIQRAASPSEPAATASSTAAGAPPEARLEAAAVPRTLSTDGMGIAAIGASPVWQIGHWYPTAGSSSIFVSVAQPQAMARADARLDPVERQALAFLVAFDLNAFDLGFSLGTDHPRLGWSARARSDQVDPGLPGPDGFDDAAPLVRTGMVAPALRARVAATFTGGFKREHGAFRYGELASLHHGSHYGFAEQGVIFSRLQPGLATLLVTTSGAVEMKTWTAGDDQRLAQVRHARQNGTALVEPGVDGVPRVGRLVNHWGEGNWSGSSDEQLRSLRAGACLVQRGDRHWLVYGYFSTATPSAMASVFLSYGCNYAMHLDMNALEHTYLALYRTQAGRRLVEHLVPGMSVLDQHSGSTVLPRFLAFPDDRDFFYLVSREKPE